MGVSGLLTDRPAPRGTARNLASPWAFPESASVPFSISSVSPARNAPPLLRGGTRPEPRVWGRRRVKGVPALTRLPFPGTVSHSPHCAAAANFTAKGSSPPGSTPGCGSLPCSSCTDLGGPALHCVDPDFIPPAPLLTWFLSLQTLRCQLLLPPRSSAACSYPPLPDTGLSPLLTAVCIFQAQGRPPFGLGGPLCGRHRRRAVGTRGSGPEAQDPASALTLTGCLRSGMRGSLCIPVS